MQFSNKKKQFVVRLTCNPPERLTSVTEISIETKIIKIGLRISLLNDTQVKFVPLGYIINYIIHIQIL